MPVSLTCGAKVVTVGLAATANGKDSIVETLSRRGFLAGAAGAALGAAGLDGAAARAASLMKAGLPLPSASGIEHVVVVMMENRSFDHLVGWLPAAEGRQANLSFPDATGALVSTYPLAPDYTGCGFGDPDHSYQGGRVEYDNGACDGWLKVNDVYSIGYYERSDLAFLGAAAHDWTVGDRYFAAIMGPTFPNRMYQHAAVTDRLSNTLTLSTLPTIWDRLAAAGLDGRYYYGNLPFLALWGAKYLPIVRPFAAFLTDCASANLPEVAFVDPVFTIEGDEPGPNDDHPHADIRAGEAFLAQVYAAVTGSPDWESTVLVLNFDEWGGFFDHVPPTKAPDVDPALQLRGFRVPMLVISPFAKRHEVSHDVFDHTSLLSMIEWRWKLSPLSARDAAANNLANALDFDKKPDLTAPSYDVAPFISAGCTPPPVATPTATAPLQSSGRENEWAGLATLAQSEGYQVG
jgi:phospholipase C